MPKIQWTNLPAELREHLFQRAKERELSMEDIFALEEWRNTLPDAPEGLRFKDFGSFKVCREGHHPLTFLLKGQPAQGEEIE
ncbi:MAG TPA: hypothetical protein VK419_11805 [Bryobacteraceae bacterium]|nr:hypothetical protein [Bryobacteraceae bacterium]